MANRFWVPFGGTGTGTWDASNTNNWSTSTGGAGGASVPSTTDSVFFDANSFNGAGQTVTIAATSDVLDMNWTGATNTPTFAGASILNIFGSLTLISAMTYSATSSMIFKSTSTGKTITSAGKSFGQIQFLGVGGGWTLQDALAGTSFVAQNGTFTSNDKAITIAGSFSISASTLRTINLGTSAISCQSFSAANATNLTFNPGTSTITMTGNSQSFQSSGLTYNNITFAGTAQTLTGSNTINVLTINAGKGLKPTSGTTQTVTTLVINGTTANPSTFQAVTAGSAATIALPAGRYFIRHTSIKDITITGATAVTSIAGTNVSGNTGITFVTKFEMGRIKNDGSLNWYSTATGAVTKVSG